MEDETKVKALIEIVKSSNFVILDTDVTINTGLHAGEIVEIAIVDHTGKVLLNTLIKPVYGIPDDAFRIHGISEDMVKNAHGFAEVVPYILKAIAGKEVIVYNAVYDRKMLHKLAEAAQVDKINWKEINNWTCAMEAYAEFYGDWNSYRGSYRWHKLSDAARNCGVKADNAHRALGDCLTTLGVINYMYQDWLRQEKIRNF